MRKQNWILVLYGAGILFLSMSAINDFQAKAYWSVFTDLEFIGFALYMIFIYPKRKLMLNQDMMTLIMIHFSVYAGFSAFAQAWLTMTIALAISLGIIGYRLYRKQHKYSFYLK